MAMVSVTLGGQQGKLRRLGGFLNVVVSKGLVPTVPARAALVSAGFAWDGKDWLPRLDDNDDGVSNLVRDFSVREFC